MRSDLRMLMVIGLIGIAIYSFQGCRSGNTSLSEENKKLRMQLAEREEEIGRLSKKNEELQQMYKKDKDTLAHMQSIEAGLKKHLDLAKELEAEIKAKKVNLDDVRVGAVGELVLDEMIFQPGKAELSDEGRNVLDAVASILKDRRESIRIDGHTDSDPIRLSKDLWSSNWELSAVRASKVAEYLEEGGIESKRISVAAFGKNRPVSSNDTPEGKKANRRVEILLYEGVDQNSPE
jgi:chemotaxis protein MotB